MRANLTGSSITFFDPRQSQTIAVLLSNGTTQNVTGNFWFNPNNLTTNGLGGATCNACALNPALRTYGTFPRNGLRGPSQANVNLAIAKQTPLFGERLNLLFRAEFFNLFNHAQFQIPNTNISDPGLFRQITSVIPDSQRIVQLALRLAF